MLQGKNSEKLQKMSTSEESSIFLSNVPKPVEFRRKFLILKTRFREESFLFTTDTCSI